MSIHATNSIRRLRGFTPSEKLVALVHADHARHDPDAHKRGLSGLTYASMSTIAEETGFRRETVTRITKRLVHKGVLKPEYAMTADQRTKCGRVVKYRVNLRLETCDAPVTGEKERPVTSGSQVYTPTCDSETHRPVILGNETCDAPVTQRVLKGEEGRCSLMQFPQDQGPKQREPVPTRSQVETALQTAAEHIDAASTADDNQHAHLEKGIFRKRIEAAYFDATQARMTPDNCIQEALSAAALSLVGNRSVELKGLSDKELADQAWDRIRHTVATVHEVKNFNTRSRQVVAVVTRCVTDVAFEFWERNIDLQTAANG